VISRFYASATLSKATIRDTKEKYYSKIDENIEQFSASENSTQLIMTHNNESCLENICADVA
jgi:hypothetical protein